MYEEKKKEKVAKKAKTGMKGIRLSLRVGTHDLEVKAQQAHKFLSEGNKVKIEMILKGRERSHSAFAKKVFENFFALLGDGSFEIETPLTSEGNKLILIIKK